MTLMEPQAKIFATSNSLVLAEKIAENYGIPFGKMVQFSFYDMKYIGARKFVGWKNYIDVFTRDDCFRALKIS